MAIPPSLLTATGFDLPTAIYLASASDIAYKDEAEVKRRGAQELGLTKIEFKSAGDTEYFIGETDAFAVLAFRGTQERIDMMQDARALQVKVDGIVGQIHNGFRTSMDLVWKPINDALRRDLPLFITGHSLGGALATLASCRLANEPKFQTCYTFGSPRVGDAAFCQEFNGFAAKYPWRNYRVVNYVDIVPEVPLTESERNVLDAFHLLGEALNLQLSGFSFFQKRIVDRIASLLKIADAASLVIPSESSLKELLTLIKTIRPAQGQLGSCEHVSTLVTIEGDGDIIVGGPELEWARALLKAVFIGKSPDLAFKCHKLENYLGGLRGRQEWRAAN